ncbi:unnamed protein product [Bursaphelenchus okinawaensis]|uniref:Amino acid transporter transmembrane domain-containing protein n=1 Tax=Bursaphelenchus okinawaensis TaxID=465554 RepID=A0A811L1I0_9BILA|nr:unnamed protein product [Bursaphelenchus okinawaensis]CAG9115045.1 unnamed protein product [Bursaphelenchus okinawaensis]
MTVTVSPAEFNHGIENAKVYRAVHVQKEEGQFVNGTYVRVKGMSWFVTAILLIGELAGGGLVTLPVVTVRTSLPACILFTLFMVVLMTFTAVLIGRCWVMLIERWPEYRCHTRKPYPEIARRAMGEKFKYIVSVCIDISQFGFTVVYVLLSARNLCDLLKLFFEINFSYCYMVVLLAAVIIPVTFLKSPQDFWQAVIVAMFTSTFAAAFIVAGGIIDHEKCNSHKAMPPFILDNHFLAVGTFFFAYANHAGFPTLQHDMKVPADFNKASYFAFGLTTALYLPVSVISWYTYGDSVKDSIINSIQNKWLQVGINIMITLHCILTITIASNPLNQEAEETFKVPQHFGFQRVIVRTGVMMVVTFAALSVPQFGALMDLCGATGNMLTALVFPCLFYLRLRAGEDHEAKTGFVESDQLSWKEVIHRSPKTRTIVCLSIAALGLAVGAMATFSAIKQISVTHFVTPCYLRLFFNSTDESGNSNTAVDCCGHYQNITVFDGIQCTPYVSHGYEL